MRTHIEILANCLDATGLDAIARSVDPGAWDEVWNALLYQSVSCQTAMIDYQHAYSRGLDWQLEDISLVLRVDGRPCGLWPLTIGGPAGQIRLSSAGAAVAAPVFVPGLSPRTIKRICTRALAFVRAIASILGERTLEIAQGNESGVTGYGCTEWHQQLLAGGACVAVKHHLYADLRPEMADIRATFRKSFKPLINAGLRTWDVSVMSDLVANDKVWSEFKQLHLAISGRSTRSHETWAQQYAMLCAGLAFLVCLRDRTDQRLVGAGFFQCTRDEALYSVGVYDRALFDKPLGHIVQQRAIETMKDLGLRWYCIGERPFHQNTPMPTDKAVSIGEFKHGFASHMFCSFLFALPVVTDQMSLCHADVL